MAPRAAERGWDSKSKSGEGVRLRRHRRRRQVRVELRTVPNTEPPSTPAPPIGPGMSGPDLVCPGRAKRPGSPGVATSGLAAAGFRAGSNSADSEGSGLAESASFRAPCRGSATPRDPANPACPPLNPPTAPRTGRLHGRTKGRRAARVPPAAAYQKIQTPSPCPPKHTAAPLTAWSRPPAWPDDAKSERTAAQLGGQAGENPCGPGRILVAGRRGRPRCRRRLAGCASSS